MNNVKKMSVKWNNHLLPTAPDYYLYIAICVRRARCPRRAAIKAYYAAITACYAAITACYAVITDQLTVSQKLVSSCDFTIIMRIWFGIITYLSTENPAHIWLILLICLSEHSPYPDNRISDDVMRTSNCIVGGVMRTSRPTFHVYLSRTTL